MQNDHLVLDRITGCLLSCRRILAASPWLSNTLKAVDDVERRMHEPMQLAIVGRICSSKSTLVNAILGRSEVGTASEVDTYNVSWIRYGNGNAPIRIHYKDGTQEDVDRDQREEWTTHKGNAARKSEVKYIEIPSDNEILRTINIIDTPGLDAMSRIDSENTVEFLKTVNPDAVILLFVRSLSADTLRLIEEFQNAESDMSFSINPMNAFGVLGKADLNWDIMNETDPIEASARAIDRTLTSRSDVSKALFRVLPLSALMGLASLQVTAEDRAAFEQIARLEENRFINLFFCSDFFLDTYDFLPLSKESREQLMLKYGLYGVYVCATELREHPAATLSDLAGRLREKSGFDAFFQLLISHFGDRAQLIKAQRGIMSLLDAINRDRVNATTLERQEVISSLYSIIESIEKELHELREWNLLLKIYDDSIHMDPEFINEFLRICGESGYSVVNKLNLSEDTDLATMEKYAVCRARYWQTKYNSWYGLSPTRAEPYAVIAKSYDLLAIRIREQRSEYEKAIHAIRIFNHYIYGKEKL